MIHFEGFRVFSPSLVGNFSQDTQVIYAQQEVQLLSQSVAERATDLIVSLVSSAR